MMSSMIFDMRRLIDGGLACRNSGRQGSTGNWTPKLLTLHILILYRSMFLEIGHKRILRGG